GAFTTASPGPREPAGTGGAARGAAGAASGGTAFGGAGATAATAGVRLPGAVTGADAVEGTGRANMSSWNSSRSRGASRAAAAMVATTSKAMPTPVTVRLEEGSRISRGSAAMTLQTSICVPSSTTPFAEILK